MYQVQNENIYQVTNLQKTQIILLKSCLALVCKPNSVIKTTTTMCLFMERWKIWNRLVCTKRKYLEKLKMNEFEPWSTGWKSRVLTIQYIIEFWYGKVWIHYRKLEALAGATWRLKTVEDFRLFSALEIRWGVTKL